MHIKHITCADLHEKQGSKGQHIYECVNACHMVMCHCASSCDVVPCSAMPGAAVPCCTMPGAAVSCGDVPCNGT